MRMLLELSEALPSIVKRKFEAAKASSDLLFSPSDLAIIRTTTGIPVSECACHCDTQQAHVPIVPIALLSLTGEEALAESSRRHSKAKDRSI